MSDWSDQITQMHRNWVEQQQQFMNDWLASMKQAGAGTPRAEWRHAADVMEQQVTSALDAQKKSLLAVAGNMENMESAPDEFKQAVKQMEEGLERWTEVQREMWKVWFDLLRDASPAPKTPAETMMESWEDMVKKTMSIQEQWLSNWTGSGQTDDKKS